jgi:uncharacterized delta-60 repeat protein
MRGSIAGRSRRSKSIAQASFECLEPRQFLSATSLDTSFNGTGKVYSSAGTFLAVANLPDGKVLVAGVTAGSAENFLIARYNANGTVDTSFGGGTGRVTTDFSGRADRATAISLLDGGKFLVAGTSSSSSNIGDFAIARYNPNGSLDTSFGTSGKTRIDFSGHDDQFGAMSVLSSGKILLAGSTDRSTGDDVAFARLNSNGKLDTTFGGTGRKTSDFGMFNNAGDTFFLGGHARSMTILPSGEFLVAGNLLTTEDGGFFERHSGFIALYKADGTFDVTHFGDGNGWVEDDFFTDVVSIAELSSGKILIGGTDDVGTDLNADSRFVIARYSSAGVLDTSFGTQQGHTITSMRVSTDTHAQIANRFAGFAVQPNGKILGAGGVFDSGDSNGPNPGGQFLGLIRYNADGKLDTSFSGDGKYFTTALDQVTGIVRGLGGKNVVVGTLGKSGILRFGADSPATASISGRFFADVNGDGIRQSGDGILAGWRAFVDSNNNGYYDVGELTSISNANGTYVLSGLAPGTYRIREFRQEGWTRTKPAGVYPLGFYDVTVGIGQSIGGKDFGNTQ